MDSRWNSAAAVLPDVLMSSLGLSSPPDIDASPIPTHLWTDVRVRGMLTAIEDRFGVVLDPTTTDKITTFADIAAAVQHVLSERTL
jgi:hypothetical protein